MAEKSILGTRLTDSKNLVWFGEIERKLAKLSVLTVLPLHYFMASTLKLNSVHDRPTAPNSK
jgi:hypothetical protein